ncbi:12844_t:CDS:1, partial [Dentiscutata heterogama]
KASVVENSNCAKLAVDLTANDHHSPKCERVDSVADGYAEYANSTASNYYSSRHVRVDDKEDDHVEYVDSHYNENKHMIEHNKEHTEKSDRCGENIILKNEGEASHLKKTNK